MNAAVLLVTASCVGCAGSCKPAPEIVRLICTESRTDERRLFEINVTEKQTLMRIVNNLDADKFYSVAVLNDNFLIEGNTKRDTVLINRVASEMISTALRVFVALIVVRRFSA